MFPYFKETPSAVQQFGSSAVRQFGRLTVGRFTVDKFRAFGKQAALPLHPIDFPGEADHRAEITRLASSTPNSIMKPKAGW